MRRVASVGIAFAVVCGLSGCATPQGLNEPPPGFVALFDGATLDGWWGMRTEDPRPLLAMSEAERRAKAEASLPDIHAHWSVENGILVNDGHGAFLTTRAHYGDFELLVEYQTVAKADSGIYLRGIPQVQIWDTTEAGGKWDHGADKGSGGLWNNSPGAPGKNPSKLMDRPFGEWNAFRIVMVGEYVTVWFNGEKVVDRARLENYFDRSAPLPPVGPIQLQTHGGEIRWRNVFLREIGAEEANAHLREIASDGLEPIFDGATFAGWRGATDDYEVVAVPGADDGAIQCKSGRGGNLFTDAVYADFEVDLEIRFPPGGNNGLAIRYPGTGQPSLDGMCELQVLENTATKYAALDARQYHGSAYGFVPAHRGYQRPVGAWNYQRVQVVGSTLRVELNGFRILDCDLSTVTEFMGDRGVGGRDRTEGHFGFCGHQDPVQFRRVRARAL